MRPSPGSLQSFVNRLKAGGRGAPPRNRQIILPSSPTPTWCFFLAYQEIEDGRLDQAESLIAAAFVAYDQRVPQ
jgi:hypothetical protein